MVRLSCYSVNVEVAGLIQKETKEGYVELPDEQQYVLRLKNWSNRCCDAKVLIDGKHQGMFRLAPKELLKLERPANSEQRFTFVLVKEHAAESGHVPGDSSNGLISVTFTPERQQTEERKEKDRYEDVRYHPYRSIFRATPTKENWLENPPSTSSSLFGSNASEGSSMFGSSSNTSFSFGSGACFGTQTTQDGGRSERSYREGGTALTGSSGQSFSSAAKMELDERDAVTIHLRLVGKPKITPLRDCRQPQSTPIPPPVVRLVI